MIIGIVGIPGGDASLVEGFLQGRPIFAFMTAYRDWTIGPVKVIPEVLVILDLAEVREDLYVGPLVVPPGSPSVEILGRSPDEGLAVDGTGPAQHLPSRYRHGLGLPRRGLAGERPVEGRVSRSGLQIDQPPAVFQHAR